MAALTPWRYYVYELTDPRSGAVFYVGKGSERRAWTHENRVRRGRSSGNKKKDEVIKRILDAGQRVITTIVCYCQREKDAYAIEKERIESQADLLNQQRGDFNISAAALSDRIYAMFKSWVAAIVAYHEQGRIKEYPAQEAISPLIHGFIAIRKHRREQGLPT